MLSWALAGLERTRGLDQMSTLDTANNLANVYAAQGKVYLAEEVYKRFLEVMQRTLGPNHELTLTTVGNLGLLYKDLRRLDEAEVMHEWALKGLEATHGRDHTLTLHAANGFGMVYRHQGRLQEAEDMFQRAMQGFEKVLGPDDPSTLDTVTNLGNIYAAQGRPMKAEEMYKRGKDGFEKARGWHHLSTLNAANNLRLTYTEQGRLGDVEQISKWVREQNDRDGGNRLHLAVRDGHIIVLRLLLAIGLPVNARSRHDWPHPAVEPSGSTALHVAAFYGIDEAAIQLLAFGADVDAACHWDFITPLNIAARQNRLDIAHILLDHGAKVNGIAGAGSPPLLDAAVKGHLEMATLLLQKGADVDATDDDGDPVLHSAAFNNKLDIVTLLLDHGANPRSSGGSGRTARWFAAERGHEAVVETLISRGADDRQEPDMCNDSSTALQSIGRRRLLKEIEKAQKLISSDAPSQLWARRLHFVVRSTDQQYNVEIVQEEADNPEPFIAVSCCWGSAPSPGGSKPLIIHDSRRGGAATLREARADVILRSLAFTESRGVKRIWVDQECINQDDGADVQVAIQAMHLVYRRAEATVAILGRHVHAVDDLAGFSDLLATVGGPAAAAQTLRDRILGDKWFTGAWCAQEQANSAPGALYYLVGWRHDVDEDGQAWKECAKTAGSRPGQPEQAVFREWVLTHGQVWSMSFKSLRNSHVMASNVSSKSHGAGSAAFTLLDENLESMAWYGQSSALARYLGLPSFIQKYTVRLTHSAVRNRVARVIQMPLRACSPRARPPKKLRMSLSQAYSSLRRKSNLLVSDRLAILSNMTHHDSRIQTKKAVDEKLSYTACVLSLALQNGDLDSFGYFDGTDHPHSGSTEAGSWLPPLNMSLDALVPQVNAQFRSACFAGDPGYVVGEKGLFRGLVWEMEAYDTEQFSELRDVLPEIFELACGDSMEESAPWRHILLQALVRQLKSAGYWELVELVVLCALPRQLKDPGEMCSLLSDLESWIRDEGDDCWPELLSTSTWISQPPPGEPVDGWRNAQGRTRLPLAFETPLLHWVYECIGSGRPLPIGKSVVKTETGDSRTLVGLFTVDPAKHRKVFTLLDGIEYNFGNWLVLPQRSVRFGCVGEVEGSCPSDEDVRQAADFLGGDRRVLPDQKVYRVQKVDKRMAVWSHRLSKNGILEKDHDGWTTVPLGQGMLTSSPGIVRSRERANN